MERKNNRFRLITISGPSGTGKSLLTKKLASHLGWPIFSNSSQFRQIAADNKLSSANIHELPKEIHQRVDKEMMDTIKNGRHLVLESRLAGWQARNFQDVLRVLLTCKEKVKVERYSSREGLSIDQAKNELKSRDDANLKNFIGLYNAGDYLDQKYYQLVISTENIDPEDELKIILDYLDQC